MAIEHVMAGIPMWQLVPGGWVYVVGDAERAGHALVTALSRS